MTKTERLERRAIEALFGKRGVKVYDEGRFAIPLHTSKEEDVGARTRAELRNALQAATGAKEASDYKISVYVRGMPGFFRYTVQTRDQAMDHFGAIVSGGYRRPNDRGIFEWFAPSVIERIRIEGPGLESQYQDEFVRT